MIAAWIRSRSLTERRALALALVPLVFTLLWMFLFAPAVWVFTSQAAWRERSGQRLDRLSRLVAAAPGYKTSLDTIDQSAIWTALYPAAPAEDITAQFEEDVSTINRSAGLRIASAETLPVEQNGPVVRYGRAISGTIGEPELGDLVSAIRTADRYLRVEHLRIRARDQESVEAAPILEISFELYGYALATEPQTE